MHVPVLVHGIACDYDNACDAYMMTAHGEVHMTVHVVAAVLATVRHRTVQVRVHGAVRATVHGKVHATIVHKHLETASLGDRYTHLRDSASAQRQCV